MTISDAKGELQASYDFASRIDHIAIDRPTKHYTPKLVLAGLSNVFLFNPAKLSTGKALWRGSVDTAITGVAAADTNDDGTVDIVVTTRSGRRVVLNVEGKVIGGRGEFSLLPP